jgi:hypothetical protein
MPNITWQEPQIVTDLLALSLYAATHHLDVPGEHRAALISPWLTNVELSLRPGPWYQLLTTEDSRTSPDLLTCVRALVSEGWTVDIGVLRYGIDQQIKKPAQDFQPERNWLRRAMAAGARIFLVPDLHAKGVITPLGIITGSTNLTHSGMYLQLQNANYFAHDHPEYVGNRSQLLSFLSPEFRATQQHLA